MSQSTASIPQQRILLLPLRALFVLVGGLTIFVLALVVIVIGFQMSYDGYIYSGVFVGGVDLSDLTPEDAASRLTSHFDYPDSGRILFTDGDSFWLASPAELGFMLGAEYNAVKAYRIGRNRGLIEQVSTQFQAWYSGINLTPQFFFDERIALNFLNDIASQIDRPTVEASLTVDGVDVVVSPGQVGRRLDVKHALEILATQVETMQDGEIPLLVIETPPAIMDVSEQAEIARRILSAPLTLKVPKAKEGDLGPWVFEPHALAEMLTIERVQTTDGELYQVALDAEDLRGLLEEIAPEFEVKSENARFIFNDDTRQLDLLHPAVEGQSLDVEATIQAINQKVYQGEHNVSLDMEYTRPPVTDDVTAKGMGITELVSSHTSYFYGSSSPRIQNIQTAAASFHGLMVPPGATFSMGEVLGDVSLNTGYAEALIIFGDRTIKGVGGGVCQVSTTLFRTIFFGGFPIVERHPHAYRVYYYEQTASGGIDSRLAGLDATVYVPVVDLKFTNDTKHWLLMETYVNAGARTLTWKFYSTSDGRSIEWETSGPKNRQDPPEPLYQENSELSKGEIKQVDWPAEGADVTVSRYVWRNDEIIHSDIISTHYLPWRAVCEYGPGTKGMPPEEPDANNPCRPDSGDGD